MERGQNRCYDFGLVMSAMTRRRPPQAHASASMSCTRSSRVAPPMRVSCPAVSTTVDRP